MGWLNCVKLRSTLRYPKCPVRRVHMYQCRTRRASRSSISRQLAESDTAVFSHFPRHRGKKRTNPPSGLVGKSFLTSVQRGWPRVTLLRIDFGPALESGGDDRYSTETRSFRTRNTFFIFYFFFFTGNMKCLAIRRWFCLVWLCFRHAWMRTHNCRSGLACDRIRCWKLRGL